MTDRCQARLAESAQGALQGILGWGTAAGDAA